MHSVSYFPLHLYACTHILIFGIMHFIRPLLRPLGLESPSYTPSVVLRKLMEENSGLSAARLCNIICAALIMQWNLVHKK